MPSKHKGYGFVDFEDDLAASEALLNMNLFELGGQQLRVCRALTPARDFAFAMEFDAETGEEGASCEHVALDQTVCTRIALTFIQLPSLHFTHGYPSLCLPFSVILSNHSPPASQSSVLSRRHRPSQHCRSPPARSRSTPRVSA
jgi:RNA recognition motif-containing protein